MINFKLVVLIAYENWTSELKFKKEIMHKQYQCSKVSCKKNIKCKFKLLHEVYFVEG